MKKNILIYDDDEEILLICKIILNKFDFAVETLSRCENILNDIKSLHPHLVVMDLWIPGIGGEKAISIIKQNNITYNLPVLLFSANSDIKQIAERVNANGYIEKPFTIETLIEKIKEIIETNTVVNFEIF